MTAQISLKDLLWNNLDKTRILNFQQLGFQNADEARKLRDWYDWLSPVQVESIFSFMKYIKLYIHALCTAFLFAESKNNNFVKEIQHILHAFISWWKPQQSISEFSSRHSMKARTCISIFFLYYKVYYFSTQRRERRHTKRALMYSFIYFTEKTFIS